MNIRFSVAAALALTVYGQVGNSVIAGRVMDSSESVVPKAQVLLVNEDSGVRVSTPTNEQGLYRFTALLPGSYRLEFSAGGFQKTVRGGVLLQVSQTMQIDQVLQVGSIAETVSVTAATPMVESQSSSMSQLVERGVIEGMPLPNRSATALIVLSPAATVINPGSGGENLPIFSVGGGRARNQQFSLDGGNVTNITGLAVPQNQAALPMEAMQEFRVISNNYAAEHGHSTGGVITMTTRSGTNQYNGSLFEYLRNSALDARNFFAAEKAPLKLNQFGGALGGPIRKDRTHFFASWEQTREITGNTVLQTVPDAAQRQGDFSGTFNAAGRQIPVYDPATTMNRVRQPFPGNIIPANRIDSVARSIAAYWPQPNRPGTITGANNFAANGRNQFVRNIVVARVDHQFTQKDQLMVRYYINDSDTENQGVHGRPESDPAAALTRNQNSSILGSYTHMFRANLMNDFRVTRLRRFGGNESWGRGEDYAGQVGLRGVSAEGFPIIGVTGFAGLGRAPFRLNRRPSDDVQYQESLSWFQGKHALKFGGEFRRGYFNDNNDLSSSGQFSFTPAITGQPGVANTGNALASFLLGEVNNANTQRPDEINSRSNYWSVFVQDDYRVSERLTLNLGLRWEVNMPRTEDNNRMNSFDTAAINPVSGTPGVITFAGRPGVPRTAFDPDYNNFGPRFGFAWRLPGSRATVVRGGAGVFFGEIVSNIIGTAAALGFSTDVTVTSAEPGIVSAMILREGFPSQPRVPVDRLGPGFGAVAPGAPPTTSVTFFERNRPTPYSLQYNLNVQHEVRPNLLVEAGYLANLSHRLTANDLTINQVRPELAGPGNAQVRRPFPQFSGVSVINPQAGNSTYHAFTIKAERRYASGLTFLGHYTFSKFIDDVTSFSEYGNAGSYMDAYNRGLDKAISGNDICHRAVISGVYMLPLISANPILNFIAGGWRTGVIASFQSGPPFTVYNNVNETNMFPAGTVRPNLVGDPGLGSDQRSLSRWFNTGAFAAPVPYRFGTSPRSVLRGPGVSNIDLSLTKTFPITERFRTEFRGEFFNFLNHANFGLPGSTLATPAFGVIDSAREPRRIQLALRLTF